MSRGLGRGGAWRVDDSAALGRTAGRIGYGLVAGGGEGGRGSRRSRAGCAIRRAMDGSGPFDPTRACLRPYTTGRWLARRRLDAVRRVVDCDDSLAVWAGNDLLRGILARGEPGQSRRHLLRRGRPVGGGACWWACGRGAITGGVHARLRRDAIPNCADGITACSTVGTVFSSGALTDDCRVRPAFSIDPGTALTRLHAARRYPTPKTLRVSLIV